jgi:hypothetical protein
MTKPIFIETDPRGITVYLCPDRWQHALDERPGMAGQEETVRLTVASPDKIYGNPPLPANLPPRTAQERYARFDGALNTHVVVVAKVLQPGAILTGVGRIETHSRLVWTAHPAHSVQGPVLWPPVPVHPPKRK